MDADNPVSWAGNWLSSLTHRDICVHLRSSAAKIPCFLIAQPQPDATRAGPAAIPMQGCGRSERFLENVAQLTARGVTGTCPRPASNPHMTARGTRRRLIRNPLRLTPATAKAVQQT